MAAGLQYISRYRCTRGQLGKTPFHVVDHACKEVEECGVDAGGCGGLDWCASDGGCRVYECPPPPLALVTMRLNGDEAGLRIRSGETAEALAGRGNDTR